MKSFVLRTATLVVSVVGLVGVNALRVAKEEVKTTVTEMLPTEFNKYGFDLQFRMSDKDSGREVALGQIGIVFVNRETRKVTLVPQAFLDKTQG